MATIKKYNGSTWENTIARKYETKSEIIVPPTTIYADGSNITAYTIKGNTVQSGTPSPSNPVDVQGVGERTENLFGETLVSGYHLDITTGLPTTFGNNSRCAILSPIDVSNLNTVTFSFKSLTPSSKYFMYSLFNGTTLVERVAGKVSGDSIDVSSATHLYISVYSQIASGDILMSISDIMLNTGSSALPYEPYGYKIPISSGGVTTNIYTAEPLMIINDNFDSISNTTEIRLIGKLVLTGQESGWTLSGTDDYTFFYLPITGFDNTKSNDTLCSHLTQQLIYTTTTTVGYYLTSGGSLRFRPPNVATDYASLSAWTTYLQQQYAAGTPVTVWYVLETPTTETITAPSIPTTEGANSITVDTTVQPSEFTATWTGWHEASVKIKLENLFDSANAQSGYLTSTGTVVEGHQNLRYTDYLSIPSGISNITQSWTDEGATLMNAPSMCFYTDNKTFISGEEFNNSNPKTFSVPVGAAYVRTCFRTFYTDIVLNEGDTPNWD